MEFISQLLEHPSLFAYFQGANNYSWLKFQNDERRLLAKPLSYFEERLPTFIRIHKTALINPAFIATLQPPPRPKMAGTVCMQDGTELPVSRRRWSQVVNALTTSPAAPPTKIIFRESLTDAGQRANAHSSIVLAIMPTDSLRLTRQCIDAFGLPYQLDHAETGAGLATDVLDTPVQEWPTLIILDARTNRPDRLTTLRELKSHDQLRSIPVVWLGAPGDDTTQVYTLEANSVVIISGETSTFVQVIEQLCRYWLIMVRLPPRPLQVPAYQ